MKALLLIAHGSNRQYSNDEIRSLTDRLRAKIRAHFDRIDCVFLELTEPSIADGIQRCADNGIDEIILLPYFLSAGKHIADDIPGIVAEQRNRYPHIDMRICDYVGKQPEMEDLLKRIALQR